ncbi:hypothetical protein A2U01_0101148, partial [Trifolium medium]|nr:hypothetical protein [Trifolium medium]
TPSAPASRGISLPFRVVGPFLFFGDGGTASSVSPPVEEDSPLLGMDRVMRPTSGFSFFFHP